MADGSVSIEQLSVVKVNGKVERQHHELEPSPFAKFLEAISTVLPVAIVQQSEGLQVTQEITLRPKSVYNGRTHEIVGPELPNIWEDVYGIYYSSLDIKGVDFRNPYLIPEGNLGQPQFNIYGLLDAGEVRELAKTSKTVRKLGVETERIELVAEPRTFILDGQTYDLISLRDALIKRAIALQIEGDKHHKEPLNKNWVPQIKESVNAFVPVETVRSSQVESTIADILIAKSEEEFRQRLAKVFSFINTRDAECARKRGQVLPRIWDADNDQDICDYYANYLPQKIALNLAKLHNAGLIHGNPTAQNVSEVGSLRDLTTCRGPAVGKGSEPTLNQLWLRPGVHFNQDIIGENDLAIMLVNIDSYLINPDTNKDGIARDRMGNAQQPIDEVKPWLVKFFGNRQEFADKFYATFYENYFHEYRFEKFMGYKSREEYQKTLLDYAFRKRARGQSEDWIENGLMNVGEAFSKDLLSNKQIRPHLPRVASVSQKKFAAAIKNAITEIYKEAKTKPRSTDQ